MSTPGADLNVWQVFAGIAAAAPDRAAIVQGDRRLSYATLADRSARLASVLAEHGLGCSIERAGLANYESGQALIAQYLHNAPEYVEGMLGAFCARAAAFNVNYRYQLDELRYLFQDAAPAAIQYHATFAPLVAAVLADRPEQPLLLQVADASGTALLPGALDYESALAAARPSRAYGQTPDDLYVVYTGGTTGYPKGVLWRQADLAVAIGLVNRRADREWQSVAEAVAAARPTPAGVLPCGPLIHGAAQWAVLQALCDGNTVVLGERGDAFLPGDVLAAVEREHVSAMAIVGDAFGWPLIAELERGSYDTSSLRVIVSGGAALNASAKKRLIELIPGVRIVENIGSSESGLQGSTSGSVAADTGPARFRPGRATTVLAEGRSRILEPGHEGIGWLARSGCIPLGYLHDAEKTRKTFPVVDGRRMSVPGDRARWLADGLIELLGRDSLTINTGGEKVFVEEVEAALISHPDVADVVVCGRPSSTWGQEVVALVVPRNPELTGPELAAHARRTVARYKVPKDFVFTDMIARLTTGKPDYRWAAERVARAGSNIRDVATVAASERAPGQHQQGAVTQ
jgi:fatty-acyl-CoA synthase